MIQRIQTIYLLAAACLCISLFFTDMMHSVDFSMKYTDNLALTILTAITSATSLVSVFLYRKRIVQMRMTVFNMIVLLALQGWIAYYFFTCGKDVAFSMTAVFPIVACILSFLAFRGIAKDEALVQSVNRLRDCRKSK